MMSCSGFAKFALAFTFLIGAMGELSQRRALGDEKKTEGMKFEIYQDAAKEYRWRLKAANTSFMVSTVTL